MRIVMKMIHGFVTLTNIRCNRLPLEVILLVNKSNQDNGALVRETDKRLMITAAAIEKVQGSTKMNKISTFIRPLQNIYDEVIPTLDSAV